MKRGIRMLSVLLACLLILGSGAAGQGRFADVEENAWYTAAVEELTKGGLFKGLPDGLFHPEREISAGEFVTVLARCVGREKGAGDTAYWCGGTVLDARQAGWLPPGWSARSVDAAGYGVAVTREEAVYLVMKALKPEDRGLAWESGAITDWGEIDPVLAETILGAYRAGITTGTGGGAFAPKARLTRAQAAALLYRAGYTQAQGSGAPSRLSAVLVKTNGWSSGEEEFSQYDLRIENGGAQGVESWQVTLSAPLGAGISQFWNCTLSGAGESLTVGPVEYNAAIPAGGSCTGIGMILTGKGAAAVSLTAVLSDGTEVYVTLTGENPGEEEVLPPAPPPAFTVPTGAARPLHVAGNHLEDEEGNAVQLRGVSTHGLAWYPQYVSKETFRTLRDDWGANVIRLALYTEEYGGYCAGGDREKLKSLIDDGVRYAGELGMYVILDWHILRDGDPRTHQAEAVAFFTEMAQRYGACTHVLYEICNEPQNSPWSSVIKPYAEAVLAAIRKSDPDGVVLVGSNTWSQDIHEAAADRLSDENVMYTFHFYAATHKEALRARVEKALQEGLPVFISECSICDASGGGGVDESSGKAWLELLNRWGVSFVAWSLSNKDETASLLCPGCAALSDWTDADLSQTGKWFKAAISAR